MVAPPFLVSAPGKTILFGEHAAVYGKPAIAAALSLRSFLLVSPHTTADDAGTVRLEFPDINLQYAWKIDSLPWSRVPKHAPDSIRPSSELHSDLIEALEAPLAEVYSPLQRTAALAFLYLYMSLCVAEKPEVTFSVRSTLPIGAGLGSSASISVCISAALCLLSGEVAPPEGPYANGGLNTVDLANIELIDAWAFLGERCMHGNPSGIDNAVASHGGAVMFQRMMKGNPNVRENMRDFPELKLLLVDTKQPRRTAVQVANVAALHESFPKVTEPILESIKELTDEAYGMLRMPKTKCDEPWAARMRELVRINHGLLVALGVSHPKLELIRCATDELEIGETKLTGAGGGGCAITLVKESVTAEKLVELRKRLEGHGFALFETSLGGPGAGILMPCSENAAEWEDWEEKLFSVHHLLALESREHVEEAIGVNSNKGWAFW
ncbi:ribosomal protein S5 domain 2-type protein [Limtongia smithiae]|uniref:ribosomal protein S5 domain 2-type protein n=1 Tax=Limtongia smithiae TaxID=1125753 RepID=UPI0034CDC530